MNKKELIIDWMKKHLYLVLLCVSIFVVLPFYLYSEFGKAPEEEEIPIVDMTEDGVEDEDNIIGIVVEARGIEQGIRLQDAEETPAQADKNEEKPQQPQQPTDTSKPSVQGSGDVLMIGDSRTVGIREYANLSGVSYYCDVGSSSFNIWDKGSAFNGQSGVSVQSALSSGTYSKVHIMLGINEIWADLDTIAGKYQKLINEIKSYQPNAKIVIGAVLHVSQTRSAKGDNINNPRINELNSKLQALADNSTVFYLDSNVVFDDASGALGSQYTSDGVHIYAKDYKTWGEWIISKVRAF